MASCRAVATLLERLVFRKAAYAVDWDAGNDSVDAKDLTEVASSVRLPAAAMAGMAGRGPGTLESEVEVIASDAEVSPDDPGGEKPVPAMIALAVETRKGNLAALKYRVEFQV